MTKQCRLNAAFICYRNGYGRSHSWPGLSFELISRFASRAQSAPSGQSVRTARRRQSSRNQTASWRVADVSIMNTCGRTALSKWTQKPLQALNSSPPLLELGNSRKHPIHQAAPTRFQLRKLQTRPHWSRTLLDLCFVVLRAQQRTSLSF